MSLPQRGEAGTGRRNTSPAYDVAIIGMFGASNAFNLAEFDFEYRVSGVEREGSGTQVCGATLSYSDKNAAYYVNFPEKLEFERDEAGQIVRNEAGKATLKGKTAYVRPPYAVLDVVKTAAIEEYHRLANTVEADESLTDADDEGLPGLADPFAE